MAMVGNDLGDDIRDAVAALSPEQQRNATLAWRAIGTAMVDYITANTEVAVSTPDVAAGSATKPGTGTIS